MTQQALPPSTLPAIDWDRWSGWRFPEASVPIQRRDPLLDAGMYALRFDDFLSGIKKITKKVPSQIEPGVDALFVATQQRLWDAMNWLSLQYSAGAPVEQIREVWPYALRWAEEYAMFHEAHHLDPGNHGGVVPHAALRTEDYWTVAIRLLCFGILTGHSHDLPRVMRFLDYGNALMDVRDGLLERLVASFLPGRAPPPDTCTRHLPYRKLFKVFAAEPNQRPMLMSKYLSEWYEASRREPYINQHERSGVLFYGYWSWEAAATAWVLKIDDSSFRDMRFYPRDLVDFARSLNRGATGDALANKRRPNVPANQHCPEAGWWFTPAQAHSRRYFNQGETMPSVDGDYGQTFWQWSPDQSAPKL